MADCCDNLCEADALGKRQSRTLLWVLVINAGMFVAVLVAALAAKSSSLFSGSIDNLGDAITYAISLYAVHRGPLAKARVSLGKGYLILFAALAVTVQVIGKAIHPQTPVYEVMGLMTLLALAGNFACLALLWRHREEDINMASVWECSRNDVLENLAVLLAALGVWLTGSQWPDFIIAIGLLFLLYRSAFKIIRRSRMAVAAQRS